MIARVLLLGALLPLACSAADEQLVPGQLTQVTDQAGFRWDFRRGGGINDGSNDLFDGALQFAIATRPAGSGTPFQQPRHRGSQWKVLQHPDTGEWVLTAQGPNGLQASRRILVDQQGFVRYVELLSNTGQQDLEARISIRCDLGNRASTAPTDAGNDAANSALGEDDTAVLIRQSGRPDFLWFLGLHDDEVQRQLSLSGDDLVVTVTYAIPAGETRGVAHVVAQRPTGNGLDESFLERVHDGAFYADLPSAVRAALVNGVGGVTGELRRRRLEHLDIETAAHDVFASGADTRLLGELAWDEARIVTRFGATTVDLDAVAGILGPAGDPAAQAVYLRDGEVLVGALTIDGFRFRHRSGFDLVTDPAALERVLRAGVDPTTVRPQGWSLALLDGTRLPIAAPESLTLTLRSAWGELVLPGTAVRSLRRQGSDPLAAWSLRTVDGTHLPVYPLDAEWTLTSQRFGAITVPAATVASLVGPDGHDAGAEAPEPQGATLLTLVDESVLAGTLAAEQVAMRLDGRPVHLPSARITRATAEADGGVRVVLDDGSRLVGRWQDPTLGLRTAGGAVVLPTTAIRAISVSAPPLSPADRAAILDLVARLGDPDWQERERAQAELAAFGPTAHPLLERLLDKTEDPEIRHRLGRLLADGKR